MEFLDHTGHIFSMPFYSKYPIGYEYETNPYIFWLDSEYTNNLSVNTYYIKPIYALFNETDNFKMNEIEITVDSKIFKLIGSKQIQDLLEKNKSYKDNIELEENKDLKDKLNYREGRILSTQKNDLNILKIKKAIAYKAYKKYKVYHTNNLYTVYKDTVTGDIYEEKNNSFTEKLILTLGENYYVIFFDKNFIDDSEKIIYNGEEYRAYYYVRDEEGIYHPVYITPRDWNRYNNEELIELQEVIYKGKKQIDVYHPVIETQKRIDKYYYIKYKRDNYGNILRYTFQDLENNLIPQGYNVNDIIEEKIYIDESESNNGYIIEEIESYISEERLNEILALANQEYEFTYNKIYKDFILIPFYVVGCAEEEGTWTTNVLIKVAAKGGNLYKEEHYTHITVGGVFKDNIEELVINGKNMGISLPKDILRAIYQNSFYADTINEELYNEKIKEYLMNFMVIKGEQGNFKSAKAALEWFGWGDKIEISKLLQNDNLIFNQYLRDYFEIKFDLIEAYKLFRNSTYISLSLKENQETDKVNEFNFNNHFWGENKPIMENLFDKSVFEVYDESKYKYEENPEDETITKFYKSYYDFVFNEIGLKICALKYYYQKYFLPIHLHIKSASIEHKVYLNDIKHITGAHYLYNERPCMIQDNDIYVEFSNIKYYRLEEITDIIDENFNVFGNTEFKSENNLIDGYKINALSVKIPIKFNNKCNIEKKLNRETKYIEEYYDCIFILKVGDRVLYNSHFYFTQDFKDESTYYKYFLLCPKLLTKTEFDITYWINNNIKICLFVNGKFFEYNFKIKEPVFNLEFGRLKYQYYLDSKDLASYDEFNQITPFDQLSKFFSFKSFIWDNYKDNSSLPENITGNLVLVNDIDFYKKLSSYKQDLKDNQFNTYYIEEELLGKPITEKDIINIYNRKSFNLNNPKSDNIHYLYYYEGENLYKKFQKVIPYYGYEINNDYIISLENLYEYDFSFNNIEEIDSFYTKSYNHFFIEIKYKLKDNGETVKQTVTPQELFNITDIYYINEYIEDDINKKDFVKVNNISEINNEIKYYVKINIKNLNWYILYYDIIIEDNEEKIIRNFVKNNDLYEYNYHNTINGFYDYIDNIDLNIFDFYESKENKYIYLKSFNLYTKENKTWANLLKISTIKPNLVNDSKYLNRILLFDLYKDKYNIYKYNKYESLDKLYEKFFYTEDIFEYYLYGELIDENLIDNFDLAEKDITDNKILYVPVDYDKIDSKNKFKYWKKDEEGNFINLIQNDELSSNIQYYTKVGKLLKHKKGSTRITLYEDYPYDMYLMHDDLQWFCIFISRETIGNNNFGDSKFYPPKETKETIRETNDYLLGSVTVNDIQYHTGDLIEEQRKYTQKECDIYNIENKLVEGDPGYLTTEDKKPAVYATEDIYYTVKEAQKYNDKLYNAVHIGDIKKEIKYEGLYLKYVKASNRFLINRYRFIPTEGINHFNENEIIVCSLSNNDNTTFKQDIGYKWEVIPKSIGITDKANVFGNTNTLIFSIGKDNIYYEKGYYTVKIKYSIDDYIQHQKEKSCIIKIE